MKTLWAILKFYNLVINKTDSKRTEENISEYDVVKKGFIISTDVDNHEFEVIQDKKRLDKIGRYATTKESSSEFIDTTKKITKTVFYPAIYNGIVPSKEPDSYIPFVEYLLNKIPIKGKETDTKAIAENHSFEETNFPEEVVNEIHKKFGSFTEFQYINEGYLNKLKDILINLELDYDSSSELTDEIKMGIDDTKKNYLLSMGSMRIQVENFMKSIKEYEEKNPQFKKYQYVKTNIKMKNDESNIIIHYSLRFPKLRIYLKPPTEHLNKYFNNSEEEFLDFFYRLTRTKLKVSRKKQNKGNVNSKKEKCPLCQNEEALFCSNFETNSAGERAYLFQNLDKNNIRFKVCSECNDNLLSFNNFIKKEQKVFLVKFNGINNSEDAKKYANEFISTYSSEIKKSKEMNQKNPDRYQAILAFLDRQIETKGIFEGSLITFDRKSILFDDYYIKNKTTPIKDEEINLIKLNQWVNGFNGKKLKHNELYRIVKRCFFSESSYWFTRDLSRIENLFYREISKHINQNYEILKEIYLFNFEKVNVNAFCNMSLDIYFFYLQSYITDHDDSEDEQKKKKNRSNLKSTLRNFPVIFSFLLKKITFKEDETMNELQNEIIKLKQIGHYLGEIDAERKNNGETEDEKKQIITQLNTTNYDALIFSLVKIFDRYKHIEIKKNNSYAAANDLLIKNKEHFKTDKVLFSEAVMYIVSGYLEFNGGN